MRPSRDPFPLASARLGFFLLLGALTLFVALLAAACGEEPADQTTGTNGASRGGGAGLAITVYSSPT